MSERDMEITFLKMQIEECQAQIRTIQSQCLNYMLNVKVMLEEGSYDEAMEYLAALTE